MRIASEMKFKFTRNLSKRVIYSFKVFVCLVPSKCLKLTFLKYIYAWYYLFIIKPRVEHIEQLEFISLELLKLNYIKKKNSIKTRFKLSTIKKEPLNLYLYETYSADQPSRFFWFSFAANFLWTLWVQVLINPNNTAGITIIEVTKKICLQSEF